MVTKVMPLYAVNMSESHLGGIILKKSEIKPLEILIEDDETIELILMKEELNYYFLRLSLPGATYQIKTESHDESYLRALMPKVENALKNGCNI